MSEAWANLEDVTFDEGTADAYAAGCRGAATMIRLQENVRAPAVARARTDFEGLFSQLFAQNATTASVDAEEIAVRLEEVATHVDYLADEARKEQERREAARAWAQEQASKDGWDRTADVGKEVITLGFADTGDKPEGPQSSPPPKTVAAETKPRETPRPGTGGGGGGSTSSARPADLRSFAATSQGCNSLLDYRPASLRGLAADFARDCQYGTIDATGVVGAFEAFNVANDEDVAWATLVAGAFERAGSESGMATISNDALFATLAAAGVGATRDDIVVDPPTTYGMQPSSGYVDDPVHAATGNFIELESDLGFAGGCATLQLTRVYNSADRGTGAFGPGWSSWTEVGPAGTGDIGWLP